jgi:hypothetical protein
MKTHPYLRAYMAGVAPPTAFLLILMCVEHLVGFAPVESFLWIPLAVVPNAFGVWNVLYVLLHSRWHHPIGLHGAALPFFIAPIGLALVVGQGIARLGPHELIYFDGEVLIPYWYLAFVPFVAIAVYYLVWKYAVGFLNRVVDLPS